MLACNGPPSINMLEESYLFVPSHQYIQLPDDPSISQLALSAYTCMGWCTLRFQNFRRSRNSWNHITLSAVNGLIALDIIKRFDFVIYIHALRIAFMNIGQISRALPYCFNGRCLGY